MKFIGVVRNLKNGDKGENIAVSGRIQLTGILGFIWKLWKDEQQREETVGGEYWSIQVFG